jgi:hypothetical protein
MSRRLLLTLFAALLLLCAGLSGVARAAMLTVAVVELAPTDQGVPAEPLPAVDSGTDSAVELADVPLLSAGTSALPLCAGQHLPPRPVLHNGHPAPCLDGLLRPPCQHA